MYAMQGVSARFLSSRSQKVVFYVRASQRIELRQDLIENAF
jgi:hypothetical protein